MSVEGADECVRVEKEIWPRRLFIHDTKERSWAAAGIKSTLLDSSRKRKKEVSVLICSHLIFAPFGESKVDLLTPLTHLQSLNLLVYGFEPGPILWLTSQAAP